MKEPSPALLEAVARRALPEARRGSDEARALAEHIVRDGAGSVAAVVFFGSQKTRAEPDAFSAYDLFVLTRNDLAFYRALAAAGRLRRSPRLVAALNLALPPNQLSFSCVDQGDFEPSAPSSRSRTFCGSARPEGRTTSAWDGSSSPRRSSTRRTTAFAGGSSLRWPSHAGPHSSGSARGFLRPSTPGATAARCSGSLWATRSGPS